VVCAAMSEGPVIGRLVVEEGTAGADDRRCAVVRLEGCSVVAAGPVSEAMVSGSPVPTDDAGVGCGASRRVLGGSAGAGRARHVSVYSASTKLDGSEWVYQNSCTTTIEGLVHQSISRRASARRTAHR
jgi:hypothetical protein